MAKFAYHNIEIAGISHTMLELNYKFYLQILFQENFNHYLGSYLISKQADKLRKLIEICYSNLLNI